MKKIGALKLNPYWRQRPWGNTEALIKLLKPKNAKVLRGAKEPYGELWLGADYGDVQTRVQTQGPLRDLSLHALATEPHYSTRIMGPAKLQLEKFPGLLKVLASSPDKAIGNLSVQVHPDARKSKRFREDGTDPAAAPKSEGWYILHAEPGAGIYAGLRPGVGVAAFRRAIEKNEAANELMNFIPVKPDSWLPIQPGLVHAIGAGVLLVEPQQISDTTFRLWDWNRVDGEGKSRPLHIGPGMDSIKPELQPKVEAAGTFREYREPSGAFKVTFESFDCTGNSASERTLNVETPGPILITPLRGKISIEVPGADVGAVDRLSLGTAILLPHEARPAVIKPITDNARYLEFSFPVK